jgi:hypothetical protein
LILYSCIFPAFLTTFPGHIQYSQPLCLWAIAIRI